MKKFIIISILICLSFLGYSQAAFFGQHSGVTIPPSETTYYMSDINTSPVTATGLKELYASYHEILGVGGGQFRQFYSSTYPNIPGYTTFPTGDIVITLKFRSTSNYHIFTRLIRVNSAGTVQESTSLSSAIPTTGATTEYLQFTWSNQSWISGSATDRFVVEIYIQNLSGSDNTYNFGYGTGSTVVTPF